jgi:hypothetical protein
MPGLLPLLEPVVGQLVVHPERVETTLTWALVGALVLGGIALLVVVAIVLGLRFARQQRELEHAERMRALELGHPPPGSQPAPPMSAGAMIGLWVPVAVFGLAFVASWRGGQGHEAWVAASIVGTAAVVCGTILALKQGPPAAQPPRPHGKPLVDPAAYEGLADRR